ncbi:uncharacterized protein LOC114534127 [Dendronephthya gigantea]|uniref:uncharacterized protein LOC114534127 n=2 Tax=Dendronephthya gigantea TaxID=151771 RepID=UPI00106CC3AC|nr:uncharacterized protein LOC114534127 [Dendronephthya gigantea]
MEEITCNIAFFLVIRSNYISNYNSMSICILQSFKCHLLGMALRETPKKLYPASVSSCIDPASCRLCRSIGDASHRKDIFKPTNRALLKIAEQLYGRNIAPDPNLPRQVCRPCERRLKNCLEFQKVISETQEVFLKRQPANTRVKRCIDVSPSISREPKSRLNPSLRTSLISSFGTSSSNADIENVTPLKEVNVLEMAESEMVNVARRDPPSVLRKRTYAGLCQENWMDEVVSELTTRCPTVAKILSTLLDCDITNPGKKLPPLCLVYATIMFLRCHELSRIQRINTVILVQGKATTNLIDRLNKYGVCLSSSKKYVVYDDIGKHFLDHAVELVKSGMKFVYVVDNIDWEERVHDMREHHQNKSIHAVATSMVFTRIPSDHLPDNGPQMDVKTCNFREIVRISDSEMQSIHSRYRMLVARILIEKFPKFSNLRSYISDELALEHEHSAVTSQRSEIMTLPVLMKDEKKYSDCVDVLDQLEEWTHEVYYASGYCKVPQSSKSNTPVEVATRPDQPRAHIPPVPSDEDPLSGIKIPCFGDELTRVRFAGARDLRSGCHTAKQRLDHLYPYRIVGWHTKRSFLKSIFKRLYKNSGRESGTLRYFREVLNRRNVTIDVKHFEDCEQLFMSVGNCYLIEALLAFFEMDNVDESPKENNPLPPNDLTDEEKKAHVHAVLDKFLYQFLNQTMEHSDDEDMSGDDDNDDDISDGVFNYSINLIKSFMVLLDCKDAVASGNGEHLALVQKQMLFYFSSVSGYNSYAIEMLVNTIQNAVLLSPAEAHLCKWAALANWKGGKNKNIEIDLLQENRNKDIKGLISLMGANKTTKAIERVSRAAGGVHKIVDVYESQALIKAKASAHSHRSSIEDENKILADLRKIKPFKQTPGRSHKSFVGISSNPLNNLDEKKFCEWLQRHQKNISVHFPTQSPEERETDDEETNQ